jgi:hypothetical protein
LRERFSHNGRSNRVQKKKWSEAEKEIHMPADFTHAYCDYCETIQPVKREKLENEDTSGQFEGGDILCTECPSIIATVYVRKKKL